jgi:hypothetical protein
MPSRAPESDAKYVANRCGFAKRRLYDSSTNAAINPSAATPTSFGPSLMTSGGNQPVAIILDMTSQFNYEECQGDGKQYTNETRAARQKALQFLLLGLSVGLNASDFLDGFNELRDFLVVDCGLGFEFCEYWMHGYSSACFFLRSSSGPTK